MYLKSTSWSNDFLQPWLNLEMHSQQLFVSFYICAN